jgi:hypothetical protein
MEPGESGILLPGRTARGLWRSLVSALDWGSRGPGFKSRQPDHCDVAGHRRAMSQDRFFGTGGVPVWAGPPELGEGASGLRL